MPLGRRQGRPRCSTGSAGSPARRPCRAVGAGCPRSIAVAGFATVAWLTPARRWRTWTGERVTLDRPASAGRSRGRVERRRSSRPTCPVSRSARPCCGPRRRRSPPARAAGRARAGRRRRVTVGPRRPIATLGRCPRVAAHGASPCGRRGAEGRRHRGGKRMRRDDETGTWRRSTANASAIDSGPSAARSDCRSRTSKRRRRQEFKASVLGAYERGERAISVPRLQRLARFYSVPVDQLLPGDVGPTSGSRRRPR